MILDYGEYVSDDLMFCENILQHFVIFLWHKSFYIASSLKQKLVLYDMGDSEIVFQAKQHDFWMIFDDMMIFGGWGRMLYGMVLFDLFGGICVGGNGGCFMGVFLIGLINNTFLKH